MECSWLKLFPLYLLPPIKSALVGLPNPLPRAASIQVGLGNAYGHRGIKKHTFYPNVVIPTALPTMGAHTPTHRGSRPARLGWRLGFAHCQASSSVYWQCVGSRANGVGVHRCRDPGDAWGVVVMFTIGLLLRVLSRCVRDSEAGFCTPCALRARDPPRDQLSPSDIGTCHIWQFFCLESRFQGTNVPK